MSRRVRPAARVGALALLAGALLLGPAVAAGAASSSAASSSGAVDAAPADLGSPGDVTTGREITRYDATVDLDADGVAHVVLDFDFDFGDDPGHGPYLTFVTRQGYDATRDRLFRFSDFEASSLSGAPADLRVDDGSSSVALYIGDEDVDDVSGVQTYRLSFDVDGWVNPAGPQHSGDELFWNVIGSGWQVPLSNLTVTVQGPAAAQDAVCFAGYYGSTDACTSADVLGDGAVFTQSTLPVGDQWTVVTGWPGGTFDTQILLGDPYDAAAGVRPDSAGGAAALAVLAAGAGFAAVRARKVGRDQEYLGLTPGLRPANGQETLVGPRRRAEVSVQFQPPEGTRPGEIGTLVDEKADPVDVTATLIDLAVRGYLRIEEVPRSNPNKPPKDWTLVQLEPPAGELLPFESSLLTAVFSGRGEVKLSDLRTTFASSMAVVQTAMYEHVTDNGWFRANPRSVRQRWTGLGIVLVMVGMIGGFVTLGTLQVRGLSLVGFALAAVGVLVMVLGHSAPARTADGTAVLAQALGFRRYLATAEANQLRFEEGEDIFSRYLPYAIVFGLTDRWARVFAELAAQGRAVAQPTWYYGYYNPGTAFWATSFAGSMDRFSSTATSSMSAPTPGSSGGSGFSGGGFSGGGVGGGGGGGW